DDARRARVRRAEPPAAAAARRVEARRRRARRLFSALLLDRGLGAPAGRLRSRGPKPRRPPSLERWRLAGRGRAAVRDYPAPSRTVAIGSTPRDDARAGSVSLDGLRRPFAPLGRGFGESSIHAPLRNSSALGRRTAPLHRRAARNRPLPRAGQ